MLRDDVMPHRPISRYEQPERHDDPAQSGEHRRRVALLRRLKSMLQAQREKLGHFLLLLERQETSIRSGDVDGIVRQAELETDLLREIEAVQRVLTPLEELYVQFWPAGETQIPPLREAVNGLRESVLQHNAHNRELLRTRIEQVRSEIELLRTPAAPRSLYADSQPTMVDIST